jgi:hypothetical protein
MSMIAAVRTSSVVGALKLERKALRLTTNPMIQAAHQRPTTVGDGRLQTLRWLGGSGSLPRQMPFAIGFGRQKFRMGTSHLPIV